MKIVSRPSSLVVARLLALVLCSAFLMPVTTLLIDHTRAAVHSAGPPAKNLPDLNDRKALDNALPQAPEMIPSEMPNISPYDHYGSPNVAAENRFILASGTMAVTGQTSTALQKPPSDFDGDGKTDIAVWRPSNSS